MAYPKLTFPVDQHAFRCLTGVDCKTTRKTLGGALVEPIAEKYHVRGQVVIVQIAVRILARRLSDHYAAVQTVHLLHTGVCVPEMRTLVAGCPLIPLRVIHSVIVFSRS